MPETPHLRLGGDVDDVATVRNVRGGAHPDAVTAARLWAAMYRGRAPARRPA